MDELQEQKDRNEDRREEVAEMIAEGYSPDEIASILSTDSWMGYSSL